MNIKQKIMDAIKVVENYVDNGGNLKSSDGKDVINTCFYTILEALIGVDSIIVKFSEIPEWYGGVYGETLAMFTFNENDDIYISIKKANITRRYHLEG